MIYAYIIYMIISDAISAEEYCKHYKYDFNFYYIRYTACMI